MQIYEEGRLPLYHFDLYRLSGDSQIEPDTLEDIGFFDYLYGEGVCIIEWAEYARDLIPPESTWIEINPDKDGRIIKIGSLT
jgi:tRNA threonylcarbamoyladenosine biosynthesis protein TsaE